MQTDIIKLAIVVAIVSVITTVAGTPLDDYVNMPDSSYTYSVQGNFRGFGYTAYVRNGFWFTKSKRLNRFLFNGLFTPPITSLLLY